MVHITIIGMGLIGTSLGMALRNADEKISPLGQIVVTGYDKDKRAVADARGRLAIDRVARNLEEALREAHLVVIAVPVQSVREVMIAIAPLLPNGVVVSDVASTKSQVLEWAKELLPTTADFVGGHPMAGKEQSGAQAADPELFKGAIYCLTPLQRSRQQSIELVEALVRQIGSKVYYIDPSEHDAYVAGVSHLPFLLSTTLVEVLSRSASWREMMPLAATGFRDISRLASADAQMHTDICLTNREAIVRWIDEVAAFLHEARDSIAAGDNQRLYETFLHAREAREQWLASKPNARPGEAAFENIGGVDVERPGLFGRLGGRSRDRRP